MEVFKDEECEKGERSLKGGWFLNVADVEVRVRMDEMGSFPFPYLR